MVEQPRDDTLGSPTCSQHDIVGQCESLRVILREVAIVAPTKATVLIHGETGTGKELIAHAVHRLSPRSQRPFIKINCAAIPATLLEGELFGHERGAFTGAIARKLGRLELAHEGTLFLDEIGDIPLELQPKLLRVLQEHEFERLGATQTRHINVRIVAATCRDLPLMIAAQQFRTDLFYRLNVFPVYLPPLRERSADIPMLVRHFVRKYAKEMNRPTDTVPAHTMERLCRYPWPGNIRELQNVIERAVILSPGKVLHPPLDGMEQCNPRATEGVDTETPVRTATLEVFERDHILETLKKTHWIVGGPCGAAMLLGVKRTTLISKMAKLGIRRRVKVPSDVESSMSIA